MRIVSISVRMFAWGAAAGASALLAQANLALHGTVVDGSGAAVPNAKVLLETPAGSKVAEATTGRRGGFTVNAPAGTYQLRIPAANGFGEIVSPVTLPSASANLVFALAAEAVTESVEVKTEDLSLDADTNQDTVAVHGDDLKSLPVFDQDFVGALLPFLDPAAGGSGGVSITVNGVEVKASTVSPSAIAEVRLNNDPYTAEFGRSGRGRIDIITKPGSPEYHGEFNFIARDAALNAVNYFATTKLPEQRHIYEGHLTRPVGHGGHTTFLSSFSRRIDDAAVAVHALGPQGAIDQNVLTPNRNYQANLSVDRDFSDKHRVSLGYNFEQEIRVNAGVGNLVLAEAGYNRNAREDDVIFSDRILVSPAIVNQLNLIFEKDDDVISSVTNAPGLQVLGGFTGGGAQQDVARTENTIHINEVVSWTVGRHYLRFGANIPQISRRAVDDHSGRLGTFTFNSLADYATQTPRVYNVQQGSGRGLYWINEIAGFVQDQVTLSKRLQVNFGLRYQWQTYLNSVNSFAPRFGLAYSAGRNSVIRAGAGVFYDRTGGDFPATFKLHNGVVLRQYQVLNPTYPNPLPPGQTFSALPSSIVRTDPHIHTPYALQYSVGLERRLGANLNLTVGYRGILGISSFRSRDANARVGPLYLTRPDPSLGFVQQIESGGRLVSNALDVNLRARSKKWFTGQAQYTLSRTETNTDSINFYPQDQYNPNNEWGRAYYDRLQRFNLLGTLHPDHWLSLGVGATLYSGAPYNEVESLDIFNTGLSNDRPAGVGRNTLQGDGIASVDLQWNHNFHLDRAKGDEGRIIDVGVGAFNAFNHVNYSNFIGNVRSPLFGQPNVALPGRQLQFSARYQF